MPAPSSEQLDYANMLLERAASDSSAVHVLMADDDMLDDLLLLAAKARIAKHPPQHGERVFHDSLGHALRLSSIWP